MLFECKIVDIVPLRIPKVYRVHGICGGNELEIELHEDIVKPPRKDSVLKVEITDNKETCLNHYFCAHGYVVSNIKLGDKWRVVISLHGFLVVVKTIHMLNLEENQHVYVGATY